MTEKARTEKTAHEFDGAIWTELKRWLFEHVFHDKCAYCEAPALATGYGDGDHHRPKGRVTANHTHVEGHDGYYWLAYHPENIFPICDRCNTKKGSQFPIEAGRSHVAAPSAGQDTPDELDVIEGPLLLNPYKDNPSEHLAFDERGRALVKNGSQKGKASIDVYDLNREHLVTKRAEAQANARSMFENLIHQDRDWKAFLRRYGEGRGDYSAAVLGELKRAIDEL